MCCFCSGRGRPTAVKKLSVAATAPPVPGLLKAARESNKKLKKMGEDTKIVTGRARAENDNMSKEKQIFFRQSAFNAEKKKLGRLGGDDGGDSDDDDDGERWGFAAAAAGGLAAAPGSLALTPEQDKAGAGNRGQLKGLFDGLSHLFTAPTQSRARSLASPAAAKEASKASAKRTPRTGLTPSRLVKTAASKQLEQERRRMLDEPHGQAQVGGGEQRGGGLGRGKLFPSAPLDRLTAFTTHVTASLTTTLGGWAAHAIGIGCTDRVDVCSLSLSLSWDFFLILHSPISYFPR